LALRRRVRRSCAFTAYLVLVAVQGLRLAVARDQGSWSEWLVVEMLLRLLGVAVALEIAMRIFGTLPEAARGARSSILAIIAFTVVLLLLDLPAPAHPPFLHSQPADVAAFETAQRLLPRLAYGSAWLFAALFTVATTFALPLDPLHRLVVMGFGAYLLLYAVTLATLPAIETHARTVSTVQTLAFLSLLGLWTYAAWRHEAAPEAPRHVIRRLWSWF
jgi:hypothetical protein